MIRDLNLAKALKLKNSLLGSLADDAEVAGRKALSAGNASHDIGTPKAYSDASALHIHAAGLYRQAGNHQSAAMHEGNASMYKSYASKAAATPAEPKEPSTPSWAAGDNAKALANSKKSRLPSFYA